VRYFLCCDVLTLDFKRLFEKKEPVIDGKEVVIWTMQQLLAGSSFNEQIQENLNKSDFGLGALSLYCRFAKG
jgi:hypothetical protein